MIFFVESIDRGIWDAITNGPFVPKFEKDDVFIKKPWSQLIESESKKAQYDCITKNIITSTLNFDEFFRVSQCLINGPFVPKFEKDDVFIKKTLVSNGLILKVKNLNMIALPITLLLLL